MSSRFAISQLAKKRCKNNDCIHPDGPYLLISEFHKNKTNRGGRKPQCRFCTNAVLRSRKERYLKHKTEYAKRYYKENRERIIKQQREYQDNNQDKIKQYLEDTKEHQVKRRNLYAKQYRIDNKDKLLKKEKQYRADNKKRISEYSKEHFKNNPEAYAAKNAKRRSAKIQRMVGWADSAEIRNIYAECADINVMAKMCGCVDTFAVDHIIPLQGNNVSGLHIETNLDIITRSENAKKNNQFQPLLGLI